MSILEKFKKVLSDKNNNEANNESIKESNNIQNNYDFEKFKETIIQNTASFDIGGCYLDNDKLTSNFQFKNYPEINKKIEVNFRTKIGDQSKDAIQQIVIHLRDEDKHKDYQNQVYIIFNKDTIKIGSSTWKLSTLAKSKGHKDFTTLKNTTIASKFEGLTEIMSSSQQQDEYGKRFEYTHTKEETIRFNEIENYLSKLDDNFVTIWKSITTDKSIELDKESETNYEFKFNPNETRSSDTQNHKSSHKR